MDITHSRESRHHSPGDLAAARAVACQAVLVRSGKGQRTLAKGLPAGVKVFDDLAAVAAHLLAEEA